MKRKIEEDKNEFSLSQTEVYHFGELVLNDLQRNYSGLLDEPDCCWSLDGNLKLFEKLSMMVVRLQCGLILREYNPKEVHNSVKKWYLKTMEGR